MDIILVALSVEMELFLYSRASGHYYLNIAAKGFLSLLADLGVDVRFY